MKVLTGGTYSVPVTPKSKAVEEVEVAVAEAMKLRQGPASWNKARLLMITEVL